MLCHSPHSTLFSVKSTTEMLLGLPIELLYEVCRHLTSPHDLAAMAQVPVLASRMKEFVRIVPQRPDQILNIPPALLSFPASTLYQPAREYTINLCEISAREALPIEDLTANFFSRENIHVMLILSHYDSNNYTQECLLITGDLRYPELSQFDSKISLFVTSYAVQSVRIPLTITRLEAPLLEDFFIQEASSVAPRWKTLNPSKLLVMAYCDDEVHYGFDYESVRTERLQIVSSLIVEPNGVDMSYRPLRFINQTFNLIEELELDTILFLKNLHLPHVKSLILAITGRNGQDKLAIPVIQDVSVPKCEKLSVKVNMCLPNVKRFDAPNLKTFSLSLGRLRIDENGEIIDPNQGEVGSWMNPIYRLDKRDFLGLTARQIYGEDREEREVINTFEGWPTASEEMTIDNAIFKLSGKEAFLFSGPSLVLNIAKNDEFKNLPTDSILELHNLKCLKITPGGNSPPVHPEYPVGGRFRGSDPGGYAQYLLKAPNLQELQIYRNEYALPNVDYNDLAQRFSRLQKLIVCSRNDNDILLKDSFSLRSLKTLELQRITEFGNVSLISSLRKSPVETLVMKDYMAAHRGFEAPPPLNLLLSTDGTTVFQETLRSFTVSFQKTTQFEFPGAGWYKPPVAKPGCLEFRDLPLLDHLVVFGCVTSILIGNCPSLEGVHIGDPDSKDGTDFMPLEVFEEQEDGSWLLVMS